MRTIKKNARLTAYGYGLGLTLTSLTIMGSTSTGPSGLDSCSNPSFVFDTFRVEKDITDGVDDTPHVDDPAIRRIATRKIFTPCATYLSSFRGDSYTFSTGIQIRPARSSTRLTAIKITTPPPTTTPTINGMRHIIQRERIATGGDGKFVDILLSREHDNFVVTAIKNDAAGVDFEQQLLSTKRPIRSISWIGAIHGPTGGLFVLEENSDLLGHAFSFSWAE